MVILKNNKLFLIFILSFFIFGFGFAGWHSPAQIIPGIFTGNFTFNGKLDLINADVVSLNCSSLPGDWILVPGNSELRVDDFCVMKYEVKNVSGVATSQAVGNPWVSINQPDSYSACSDLGVGYHLITDEEWVTIARNIENVDPNWSGAIVGSGTLARGWSASTSYGDSWTNTAVAPVSDSSCLYNTGADICGSSGTHLYKRTLELSNGEIIWDLSGNVWEWTQGQLNTVESDLNIGASQWNEWDLILGFYDLKSTHLAYNSTQGIGSVYTDVDAAYLSGEIHSFIRGGNYGNGQNAGMFALHLGYAPSYLVASVGFRCSFS